MRRPLIVMLLVGSTLADRRPAETASNTFTGWVACDRCAPARLTAKRLGPVNRTCAQRCIAEGARVVFIDERGRRLLDVINPARTKGQEGHYIRITGSLDAEQTAIDVHSITVLEDYVALCARQGREP